MIRTTLIALTVAAALLIGCGDDDTESAGAMTSDAAMTEGNAMKDDGDAMKDDGYAMKDDGAMKDDDESMASDEAMSAKRAGALVKVVDSDFGRVIADRKGEAFYLFDREQAGKSECYGACAAAWPPVLTKGAPRAGMGAKAGKLGTTRRRDGKLQVTYAGQPLYYYVDDAPGKILCHDVDEFGGTWLVVQPNGRAAA